MPVSIQQVRGYLDRLGFHYFVSPNRDAVMIGIAGLNGNHQFVADVQETGGFLQLRSLNYLYVKRDHPHLKTALEAIADLNFALRAVKFGWDGRDGEIVVYCDAWVTDGNITEGQFTQMLFSFMQILDMAFYRLSRLLETGRDPGNESPEEILRKLVSSGMLEDAPEDLKGLLKKTPTGKKPGSPDDFSSI